MAKMELFEKMEGYEQLTDPKEMFLIDLVNLLPGFDKILSNRPDVFKNKAGIRAHIFAKVAYTTYLFDGDKNAIYIEFKEYEK